MYALDGIRGLAALIVIAAHTGAFGMEGQGSIGVLLFFLLSGFVLTLPFAERPSQIFNFGVTARFFINRILRIVPAYVVAVLYLAWYLQENWDWVATHLTFVAGWNHLWSVVQEARFYVLFPFVMASLALLSGVHRPTAFVLILIVAAYLLRARHPIDLLNGEVIEFYFWYFLSGILICLIYRACGQAAFRDKPTIVRAASVLGILVLAAPIVTSDQAIRDVWVPLLGLKQPFTMNGWRYPEAWCLLLGVLLLVVTIVEGSLVSRWMRSWPMRHLGLLSYSLYLFHIPAALVLRDYALGNNLLFLATFSLAYVAAFVSYIVVEKPFLNLKPKGPLRTWILPFTWKAATLASVLAAPAAFGMFYDYKGLLAKQNELIANVDRLQRALESYNMIHGRYPMSAGDMPIRDLQERLTMSGELPLNPEETYWSDPGRRAFLYVSDGWDMYAFMVRTESRANVFSPRLAKWCVVGMNVADHRTWNDDVAPCPWTMQLKPRALNRTNPPT